MHDITADFEEARLHAITGPARSGKTLLMHLLGLMDEPDFGSVELFGQAVSPASDELRRKIRNQVFGFVFPSPCLLPGFTVAENVAMPLFRLSGADEHIAHRRVREVLDPLGLSDAANERAAGLPFDRQNLVALARALVHRPRVLFLVEPSRPAVLAEAAQRLVREQRLTILWSGLPGEWSAACNTVTQLETGGVLAGAES